ncbi:MAG: hypothetical protein COA90_01655 [Gammaproteobacteria bacterium]|nr:MAG: hypothetical protein COA90_01655 [Gammaproteobacteria bacterium]
MKKLFITTSLVSLLALSSSNVIARSDHHRSSQFEERARVTHVEPIYRTVRVENPQHDCSYQRHQQNNQHHKSYTSTITGGLIGGVIGNQFGGGSGKTVMTIAGTLLGGSVGRDLGHSNSYQPHNSNRQPDCRVSHRYHHENRIDAYNVTYHYQGRSYTTEMKQHPGRYIPVEVTVRPIHHSYR